MVDGAITPLRGVDKNIVELLTLTTTDGSGSSTVKLFSRYEEMERLREEDHNNNNQARFFARPIRAHKFSLHLARQMAGYE